MDVKKIGYKDKSLLVFNISSTTNSFCNTLRRLIIDDVPTMAIEDVEFRKNSSILYDEIISHRLGLIPLTTDLKSYVLPEDCKCKGEGCAKCSLKATVSTRATGYVYASKMKIADPKVKPVHEKIPIVKLTEEQVLELEATAILGTGSRHSKWSPGLAWFANEAKITTNDAKLKELKDRYPRQIFKSDGKINKDAFLQAHIVDACEGIDEKALKVDYVPDSFMFTVESFGQLDAKEMVTAASDVFTAKLDEFAKAVKVV